MPAPSLASRASARVCPSSSCSEISTGQVSTIVMAAHLLPDAGAAYVAARGDTSILRPTGIAGEAPHAPTAHLLLPGRLGLPDRALPGFAPPRLPGARSCM